MTRWIAFFGLCSLLFLFVFLIAPMGRDVPILCEILKHNRQTGINISGLFYSEVDEVADFTQELQSKQSGVLRPTGSISSLDGNQVVPE